MNQLLLQLIYAELKITSLVIFAELQLSAAMLSQLNNMSTTIVHDVQYAKKLKFQNIISIIGSDKD